VEVETLLLPVHCNLLNYRFSGPQPGFNGTYFYKGKEKEGRKIEGREEEMRGGEERRRERKETDRFLKP